MKDEKGAVYHGRDKCHNRTRKRGGEDEYFPEEDSRLIRRSRRVARALGLHNKTMAIFIEHRDAIVLLTTIGFPVLGVHAISSILVAMPRDSTMKTFEMPRTVDVRGKKYWF
ncbi:hypothetical protein APICC_05593 [Apis cerana cerana]|uniref:Uncharacterized protein n=1 Tax=Apis cerana cerana TaxID=94128 RepID=A0A2A3EUG8_APICC|nr:hypothetical protein APICC_05593 [Apis cerana cerana]